MTRIAAVLRTNATSVDCSSFLKAASVFLAQRLDIKTKNLTLELHLNVPIIRGGCLDNAMNIDIHHNTDDINKATKIDIAEDIADFVKTQLNIDTDRTLVLFFDTRKCT